MANVNVFFEKYKKQVGILLGTCLLIWGAIKLFDRLNPSPQIAFYYSKNILNLNSHEEQILLDNTQSPLYLHLMDIVWDEDKQFAIPNAQLKIEKPLPLSLSVIPVIKVANEVFEHLNTAASDELAQMIAGRIEDKLLEDGGIKNPIKSLQIDCDWSPETKERYFVFIQSLANSFDFPIFVTLRLHQIQFREAMGIPPVKRAILFYFNTGELQESKTRNIFKEPDFAEKMTKDIGQYPLALDLALPLFKSGAVVRKEKVVHLYNNLKIENFEDDLIFEKISPSLFRVLDEITIGDFHCMAGDEIEIETIQSEQLVSACKMLSSKLKKEKREVCFYYLDSELINSFSKGFLPELVKKLK